MKRIIILAVLLLAGCSSTYSHPATHPTPSFRYSYPASVTSNWMAACENDGVPVKVCACGIDWFKNHVSYSQYLNDAAVSEAGGTPADAAASVQACKDVK